MSSSPTETGISVDVTMPQMGVSVAEGTVVEWKKQPGDWVEADEIIASISTDKIDTDVESPATGRVQEILVEVGTTVDVGTVMARIATDAKPGEAHASENDSASSAGTSEASAALDAPGDAGDLQGDTAAEHEGSAQEGAGRRSGGQRYSPVVMRMAAEHGLDLSKIEGTGRGGRVRKQDVLAFLESGDGAAALDTQPTSSAGTGGELWSWTYAKSQKVANLRRDARCTLQVEAGDSYRELRGVMIKADVVLHREVQDVADLGREIFRRYTDPPGGELAAEVDQMVAKQAPKRVALQFVERNRASWDHRKLGDVY